MDELKSVRTHRYRHDTHVRHVINPGLLVLPILEFFNSFILQSLEPSICVPKTSSEKFWPTWHGSSNVLRYR